MAAEDNYKHLKLVQTEPRSGEERKPSTQQELEMKSSMAVNSQQEAEPEFLLEIRNIKREEQAEHINQLVPQFNQREIEQILKEDQE